MSSKEYKHNVEKFTKEVKLFFNNYDYSLGEMLYTLEREINKKGKNYLNVSDEEVIECLEKSIINERE